MPPTPTPPVTVASTQTSETPASGFPDWLLTVAMVPWRRWLLVLTVGAILGGMSRSQDAGLYMFGFAAIDITASSLYLLVRRLWRAGVTKHRSGREGRR